MILFIDNYDSFTYNLVQYLGEIHPEMKVYRNDAITVEEIEKLTPDYIVISPGPCTPKEAGISVEVIKNLGHKFPILGVCLGHQSIGYAFDGEIVRADRIMHGKTSLIYHNNHPLFHNVPSPFVATRYHSLIIKRDSCPNVLEIIAETEEKEIMAVAHKKFPIWGVQFHPESILTEYGKQILRNFLNLGKEFNKGKTK
ncbi:MAG: aminodeoxychorismate/anthranilate synthase component II [Candidatus Hydrogenedentes bacterium]|nr:aminodeoxychorismate/anthranilate synthase component II [Candidatus Hydrogenedentota bacterium]